MKKWVVLFGVVVLFSMAVLVFAAPGQPAMRGRAGGWGQPGWGAGMMPGAGPRGPMAVPAPGQPGPRRNVVGRAAANPRTPARAQLNEGQRERLKNVRMNAARRTIRLRAAEQEAALALREAMAKKVPDEAEVMTAIDRLHQAKAELQKAQYRARLAARAIGQQVQPRQQRAERPAAAAPAVRPDRPADVVRPRRAAAAPQAAPARPAARQQPQAQQGQPRPERPVAAAPAAGGTDRPARRQRAAAADRANPPPDAGAGDAN